MNLRTVDRLVGCAPLQSVRPTGRRSRESSGATEGNSRSSMLGLARPKLTRLRCSSEGRCRPRSSPRPCSLRGRRTASATRPSRPAGLPTRPRRPSPEPSPHFRCRSSAISPTSSDFVKQQRRAAAAAGRHHRSRQPRAGQAVAGSAAGRTPAAAGVRRTTGTPRPAAAARHPWPRP